MILPEMYHIYKKLQKVYSSMLETCVLMQRRSSRSSLRLSRHQTDSRSFWAFLKVDCARFQLYKLVSGGMFSPLIDVGVESRNVVSESTCRLVVTVVTS
jgi:hypothetical protein